MAEVKIEICVVEGVAAQVDRITCDVAQNHASPMPAGAEQK